MKKTLLVGGMAALVMATVGGVAVAQQPSAQDRPARGLRADTDGDGRLSQAEFVGRRMQRLTAVDANRDGSVTADERRTAMQARRAQRADARFDRLDANDDGSISRAEFDARKEARAERGPHRMRAHRGPGRGHGPARMARMEARGPVVIAEAQARAEQAFARLDGDHDGYVTADERRADRQAMHEQRRERRAARRAAQPQASPQPPASE